MKDGEVEIVQAFYDQNNSLKDCVKKFGRCTATWKKYLNKRTPSEGASIKNKLRIRYSKAKEVSSWRKRTKLKLIEYKGGKCVFCNYNKCTRALQFHHRDPSQKDFQISGTSKAFETLKKEVDKCDLVCSNCHAEIHDRTQIYCPVAQSGRA